MKADFDKNVLKKAFGSFATGVAVATSHKSGFTINSFASLSLEPPLIIFNIYKSETDHVDFLKNNSFVINFLSNEQEEISRLFATKDTEKVSKTVAKTLQIAYNQLGYKKEKVWELVKEVHESAWSKLQVNYTPAFDNEGDKPFKVNISQFGEIDQYKNAI